MKKEQKSLANDLLLPIIAILGVLPLIVRFKEYDYGYEDYDWHGPSAVIQDLYTWYKQNFLYIVIVIALCVLLFRIGLYRNQYKSIKVYIPALLYYGFVVLSAILSDNQKAAWLGNFVDLEGTLMIGGFLILSIYAYEIYETDIHATKLLHAMEISFGIMSIIGYLQVFEHDLLQYPFMQKLIMSSDEYAYYGGSLENIFINNNVFLTLYNPNFAAIYLVMFGSVFAAFTIYEKNKKERIIAAISLGNALILTWFTYTRAALVAIILLFILGSILVYKKNKASVSKKGLLKICGIGILVLLLLLLVDHFLLSDKYISRMVDSHRDNHLEYMLTKTNGVELAYAGDVYRITTQDASHMIVTKNNNIIATPEELEDYRLPIKTSCDIFFYTEYDSHYLLMHMYEQTLQFEITENTCVLNGSWGKDVALTKISHVNFHGLEELGSGRIYIWSRILPLLPKKILWGSGQDTFAEVFPQNDYAGKMVYSDNTAMIIERAHNDYLKIWIQTGLLGLLCLLVFYGSLLLQAGKHFVCPSNNLTAKSILGFGCFLACTGYMICSLFMDGSLYTTPIFYVFTGLTLATIKAE